MVVFSDQSGQGDDGVAADWIAKLVNRRRTIDVGVENQAQIGFVFEHRPTHAGHRLLVFRIWNMVWKRAVRFKKLAAGNIGAKRSEHVGREKAARPVAGVDNDVQIF